jgi:hypothetical protein
MEGRTGNLRRKPQGGKAAGSEWLHSVAAHCVVEHPHGLLCEVLQMLLQMMIVFDDSFQRPRVKHQLLLTFGSI